MGREEVRVKQGAFRVINVGRSGETCFYIRKKCRSHEHLMYNNTTVVEAEWGFNKVARFPSRIFHRSSIYVHNELHQSSSTSVSLILTAGSLKN